MRRLQLALFLALASTAPARAAPTIVSVGYNSTKAAYSTDHGATWAAATLPAAVQWRKVIWSVKAQLFVAIAGFTTTFATSPDGQVWTGRTMPNAHGWASLGCSPTLCVATTNDNSVTGNYATSTDGGVSWTARTMGRGFWGPVVWNGAYWAMVEQASGPQQRATSTTGLSWTITSGSLTPSPGYDMIWTGAKFIFADVVCCSTNAYATSSDGVIYAAGTLPTASSGWWLTTTNGTVVLISGGTAFVYTSSDLTNWAASNNTGLGALDSGVWDGLKFVLINKGTSSTTVSTNGTSFTAGGAMPSIADWTSAATDYIPSSGTTPALRRLRRRGDAQ